MNTSIKWLLRLIFVGLFTLSTFYIVSIESERYESKSIALLNDLSKKQKMNLGDMLLGQSSSTMQDSKILELYIRSHEMFNHIDIEYNLSKHYAGEELDFVQRLDTNSLLPNSRLNKKNLLEKYNEDLMVIYDDPSGTLELTFIHTDPKFAQRILQSILGRSDEIINRFAKENAKIALAFIEKQREEKRVFFVEAIKKLIAYQNKHHTIDPSLDVERKIAILTELETEEVKGKVEYATKLKTFNSKSREMQMLKENIRNLHASIERVKKELSGTNKGNELNTNVFDFELLKSDMEFSKEVYRQTLINQEEVKMEVSQKSKNLVVVAKPTLADDYTYPNKLWDIFTTLIVFLFIYSILTTIMTIIHNHKD